jgi:hypothetical protein
MPRGLPQLLVTNTAAVTEEFKSGHTVRVEDVAKLWKGSCPLGFGARSYLTTQVVYKLNSTHTEADEGTRLENFFWRIWSNPSVLRSLGVDSLARIFISISEGGNRVRTTPVPTPLAATPIQVPVRGILYRQKN